MKQEITRILMAALVLLCSVPASAYDAEIDGIFGATDKPCGGV